MDLLTFCEIWCIDFEFSAPPGEPPNPLCLVARELRSGCLIRLWQDDLSRMCRPPYGLEPDVLVVAYYASAELGRHLVLGWPMPTRLLDLYAEFRNRTNGLPTPCGTSLLGAMTYFGLDGIDVADKESMRQLALRGGPWTRAERQALLDYCEGDVTALTQLLPRMAPELDLPRGLLRGRYMAAAARMEHCGIPLDIPALTCLQEHWTSIQEQLVARINADYGVFDGRTFKVERWERWLARHQIPWPQLASGALALDDDTFREMARSYPDVAPIRELCYALSQMRLADLAVGRDGRNRCLLSAFRARTGRNQPSNSRFIFGPAVWLRGLIKPEPGAGLAYIDWGQQEFGIAAALSGDRHMLQAYESGDPYLAFAKQAGAIPPEGTKASHGEIRDRFNACALAVQYGMGEDSLAVRIGQSVAHARELLRLHRETYPVFWDWSDAAIDHAMLLGRLQTVFGWTLHTGVSVNPRSFRNFPMQANGAEMLRLACCLATEQGIRVCAPIHDALLIEAPLEALDDAVDLTQRAMADASAAVLGGVRLRSDAALIRYPDRYRDERGQRMWTTVWGLLQETLPYPVGIWGAAPAHHRCAPCHNSVHSCTPVLSTYRGYAARLSRSSAGSATVRPRQLSCRLSLYILRPRSCRSRSRRQNATKQQVM
jgi:DNA polymerase family A